MRKAVNVTDNIFSPLQVSLKRARGGENKSKQMQNISGKDKATVTIKPVGASFLVSDIG